MPASAADQLTSVQATIAALESGLLNVNVQEYETADGRRVKRADFAKTLEALYARETILLRRYAVQTGQRRTFTLGRIGKTGRTQLQ